jgi:murein DD-endopeptidase MepM/ murein hydrolase activator NlpD
MIRLILILIFVISSITAKEDINRKISKTSSELKSFSKNYTKINKKMAANAKAILKQKRELEKQNKYLYELKKELKEKEISYKNNTSKLKLLKKSQTKLQEKQEKIEEELVFVIAQSVSLSVMLEEDSVVNSESLIEFEVLNDMLKNSKEKASILNKEFYDHSKNIKILSKNVKALELAIADIDKKRKDLLQTQAKNKKALKKLKLAKASYKKQVKNILKKQDILKKTLSELNIVKIDRERKAREEKERNIALEQESQEVAKGKNLPKVKKHGSSYQAIKTKRYRGKKTIAPLDSYSITKSYGTYTDPIYGIKIFNESISLKPKKRNAKVKTVFNGKVIYADKTAVLDNIVIVEHKNGLHTIYANLSQIAPNIRKGSKIKKGYTIGRVTDELVFEVTQKSFHINPIRLFK